jgi:hypothetical protein
VNVTFGGVAHSEHQRYPLGCHPPCHEREDLRGCLVEPLRIVDKTQQRCLLGDLGQQVEGCQPDQEPIRRGAAAQPEGHVEGGLLRLRQRTDPVQQRPAQLVQAGECELRLRLHPHRRLHPEPQWGRGVAGMFDQRRLPNARFAAHHKHPASTRLGLGEQVVDGLALRAPAQKVRQLRPRPSPRPSPVQSVRTRMGTGLGNCHRCEPHPPGRALGCGRVDDR